MLQNNRQITISTAGSRRATQWPPSTIWWSELVDRLRTPVRGTETLAQYLALNKTQQDNLKDVGGFVAGALAGGRRKAGAVLGRDVLTLDLDNVPAGGTQDVLRRVASLNCAYCVYSTRKHEEARPRLRVLLPCDRTATGDEYEPLLRKVAQYAGLLEWCDPSTFEATRLMYWPSCCADSQYVHTFADKPFLSADGVLAMYGDWRSVSEWPQVPGVLDKRQRLAAKQGDPTAKAGVVGAFCRIYDVYRAMEELIPGEYLPCDIEGRYTFAGGSTTGGAVIYDNGAFLYSHHATDPCGGRLVNAFDMVRLHRYGALDDEAKPDTPTNKLPSYAAMCQSAVADTHVAALLNQERYERATQDFETPPEETANWIGKLAVSPSTGTPAKTVDNVLIILENDPLLKGKLAFDEFANRGLALGPLPWDKRADRRHLTDVDDAGLRHYIERAYSITGKERVYDAATLCIYKHKINDVQDYLTGLEWDGVRRLDTLLIDYLGSADTVYTRMAIRKSLAAAVARAMTPGAKYDYMPILAGPQGIGKSTFLRLLGRRWYSDSLQTFEGKEASEMVQGTWINELGELNGLTKSETNSVKQFLSRTEDIFREPYGRRTGVYPRRCVFFGTTNDSEFLRDRTGNRRFWPVDVGVQQPVKNIFRDLEAEVPQIWAEAFMRWQLGEQLYLTDAAEKLANLEQENHRESNAKEGIIREFISRPVPQDWDKRNLQQRQMYWTGEFGRPGGGAVIERDRVCAAEIWCECFGKEISFMKRSDALEINGILGGFRDWEKHKSTQRFGFYGIQKGFTKL